MRAGVAASDPLQVTVVEPIGNGLPETGVHLIAMGASPPVWSGGLYVIVCAGVLTLSISSFGGQANAKGPTTSGGGDVGLFGL